MLGAGWQHNYNARLFTPSISGGESGRLIVMSPTGNRLRFDGSGSGPFDPWPGVNSTLTKNGTTFIQTLSDQTQYLFRDTDGWLTAVRDSQGRQVNLVYNTTLPTQLDRIVDAANSGRYLQLAYSGGRISSVTDSAGRQVGYGYDASGNLTTLTDLRQAQTSYSYATPANHLLTRIRNPLNQDVEQIAYNTGVTPVQVQSQTLQDGRSVQFSIPAPSALGGMTTITSTGSDGRVDIKQLDYAGDNTLVAMRDASNPANVRPVLNAAFDGAFSPGLLRDGNGNPTTLLNDPASGLPLSITDALGQVTANTYDGNHNLLRTLDPLGIITAYSYDSFNNLTSTSAGSGAATTTFSYQYKIGSSWGSSQSGATDSRLFEQTSADGVVTRYLYDDASNQPHRVTTVIVGPGSSAEQRTAYTYDAVGRVDSVTAGATTALARIDKTVYNADNTIARTIENFKGTGVFTAARPDENIITSYGYDKLGRTIAMTDTLGRVDVTRYNARGQVEATARNVSLPWSRDTQGQPVIVAFSTATPERNIATLYGYDGLGRAILVSETGILTGTFDTATLRFAQADVRVTRTQYDELNRPVAVTRNYRASDPRQTAEINVTDTMAYDAAGNIVQQTDAYGRITQTVYDVLNRPVRVVRNEQDGQVAADEPADQDLISTTTYDAGGRVSQTVENYVNGVVEATDTIADRTTLYQYDTLGRVTSTTQNYAPAQSGAEWNRQSLTNYDPLTTRLSAQRTPQYRVGASTDERWTRMQLYDPLGRLQLSIQNCRTAAGAASATNCAAYSPAQRDRNIAMCSNYDVLGRVVASTENYINGAFSAAAPDEDVQTRTTYDGVGRVLASTRNFVDGSFSDGAPAEDVITRQAYDGLGRTVALTETVSASQSAVSRYSYDALGRPIAATDPVGRVTQLGYDGGGTQRWLKRPDGRVSVQQLDGLGRVAAAIDNYHNGTLDTDPSDRDLITRTLYDKAGRRVQTIDPAGRVTQYAYDNADQLIGVTENAASGACAKAPCNVLTQYRYDRVGNRIAIVDANNHTRTFSYNAASEQIGASDALGQTTSWQYDALGRVTAQLDPRRATATPPTAYDLSFGYDGLDRRTQTAAGSSTTFSPIAAAYDALGRRTSLSDGSGATSFQYDALGRMTQASAPTTGSVGYAYNGRGDRVQLVYPGTGAPIVSYQYFADGRLQTVSQSGVSGPLASYAYDAVGRVAQVARANGALTNYGYDQADRLRAARTAMAGALDGRFDYQTDRLGQRTAVTETLPSSVAPSPTRLKTVIFEAASLTDPASGADSIVGTVLLNSTTPLKEFYSAVIPSGGTNYLREDISASDELFVSFYLRVDALPASTARIVQVIDGGTTVGVLQLTTTGNLRLRNSGTTIGADSAALTVGQTYRVGLHQKKGTGSDAVLEGYLADASGQFQFGSPFAASTSESFTSQATRVQLGATTGSAALTLDDIALDGGAFAAPSSLPTEQPNAAATSTPAAQTRTSATATSTAAATGQPGNLPLAFVPNSGQSDAAARFVAHGLGGALFVTADGMAMALPTPDPADVSSPRGGRQRDRASRPLIIALRYENANPAPTLTGLGALPGKVNYLYGSDPSKWRTNLSSYASLAVSSLYPGIELRYDGGEARLATTYNVAPGADPSRIRWRYLGARKPSVDAQGNLVTALPPPETPITGTTTVSGTLLASAPLAWQVVDDQAVTVAVRYVVAANGSVGFALGAYDASLPLTIDPVIEYQTYLGGSGSDTGEDIALDHDGNAYITGSTTSASFLPAPLRPFQGGTDAFVAKLSADGSRYLYTTYLGGHDDDFSLSIAVDAADNAYITGSTRSNGPLSLFPTTSGVLQPNSGGSACAAPPCTDLFVAKLNATGSQLVYSTRLGGSNNDFGQGIAVDTSGNAYVVGATSSTDFPSGGGTPFRATYAGGTADAVIAKLNPTASALLYRTYLGGTADEIAMDVAVDSAGNAAVVGTTTSGSSFPTNHPLQGAGGSHDAFVVKLNPTASTEVYGTLLGTSADDQAFGVTLDLQQRPVVVGIAGASTIPNITIGANASSSAFVVQFSEAPSGGQTLPGYLYAQYVGGSGADAGYAVTVAPNGDPYITGETSSSDLPDVPAWTPFRAGVEGFVARILPGFSYAGKNLYLFGSGSERGRGIAADRLGNVLITGDTSSTDFMVNSSGNQVCPCPVQGVLGGGVDGFVVKLRSDSATVPLSPDTRQLTYSYDGLLRLVGAAETPGTTLAYSYDLAGNRTEVRENNVLVEHRDYNAANQVVGWLYDQAGNLRNDGTNLYSYDALNRVQTAFRGGAGWTASYNGDGVLVAQTIGANTTRYTQDLAAPLSQVLQVTQPSGTTHYLYGMERLAAVSGTARSWYVADGLGSVRRTLTDAGAASTPLFYDPWGTVESGSVPTFGFAGELHDTATGLVNLRARWYSTGHGTFTSRDTYAGMPQQPYSLHSYQYGYSNPVLYTDPTGSCAVVEEGMDCHRPGPQSSAHGPQSQSDANDGDDPAIAAGGVAYTGPTTRLYPNTGPTQPLVPPGGPAPEVVPGGPLIWIGRVCLLVGAALMLSGDTPQGANPRWQDPEYRKVLVVGEQPPYPYATALATQNPKWEVIGSSFGKPNTQDRDNQQANLPNLLLLKNVDATKLEVGRYTSKGDFDDIIFNSPRADVGWVDETATLIDNFLQSAHNVLRTGGAVRMSCTAIGWPCSRKLEALWRNGPPPGYGKHYRSPYKADFRFNIPMQWRRNDGSPLNPATPVYWYGFQKG